LGVNVLTKPEKKLKVIANKRRASVKNPETAQKHWCTKKKKRPPRHLTEA